MTGSSVEKMWLGTWASVWVSSGFITRAFCLAGQMSAQLPHPVQSKGLTWIRNLRPLNSLPLASTVTKSLGASLRSSSEASSGRMTAWGQTKEHWLHWMQFSGSQAGTLMAIPLFSYCVVAVGKIPSAGTALTGSLSPCWASMGASPWSRIQAHLFRGRLPGLL